MTASTVELIVSRDLLEALVDDDPCSFDYFGGCQTHGYWRLRGKPCPQAELKAILDDDERDGTETEQADQRT